jgi:uncharacterized protein involved in exopolysaccharide biosynthesis
MEILRSRALAQKVYRKLKRNPAIKMFAESQSWKSGRFEKIKGFLGIKSPKPTDQEKVDELIYELQKEILVDPIKGSNVIQVRYQGTDREETALVLQTIIEEYIELYIEIHSLTHAEAFFKERIVGTKAKLDSLENILKNYKTTQGMIAYDLQQNQLLDQVEVYHRSLTRIRKEIMSQNKKLAAARRYIESESISIVPFKEMTEAPAVAKLRDKIIELKLQRNALVRQRSSEYLPVKSLTREIKLAENELKAQMKKLLKEEEVYLNSLKAEEEALQVTLGALSNKAKDLPEKELVVNRLNLAIKNYRDLYSLLIKKYEELKISEASDARLVKIKPLNGDGIQVATVGPHRVRNMVLAAFFGFLLSMSLIVSVEYLNPTIRGQAECEALLKLPLLESIPETKALRTAALENSERILLSEIILN